MEVHKGRNSGLICGVLCVWGPEALSSSPLLIILVFGAVFEDAGELCVVEVAPLVDGCLAEQLVHLFVCEAIAHGGQQFSQMVLVDHTLRRHINNP